MVGTFQEIKEGLTISDNLTFYVNAATGNDTQSGLTAALAKKTIQAAIDAINILVSGVVTINIAAGTYSENIVTNVILAQTGNSDGSIVLKLVGDDKTTTFIEGANTSYTISHVDTLLTLDIDKITVQNSAVAPTGAIYCIEAALIIRDIDISNATNGIYCSNHSFVSLVGTTTNNYDCSSIAITVYGSSIMLVYSVNLTLENGIYGIIVNNSYFASGATLSFLNTDRGISSRSAAYCGINGTLNFDGLTGATGAAFEATSNSIFSIVAGVTVNFNTVQYGVLIQSGASWTEGNLCNYNWGVVAQKKVIIKTGGIISSVNNLNITSLAADVEYLDDGGAESIRSQDVRYLRTKRTLINASPYAVLKDDVILGADTTTIPIIINLPTAASYESGRSIIIKDELGNAAVNNITINPSGAESIDGLAAPIILNINYSKLEIYSNGTNWNI
jgi:hypothetical protein